MATSEKIKKVVKKATATTQTKKISAKAVNNKKGGGRRIVKLLPSQNNAVLNEGGSDFKVFCQRNKEGNLMVANLEGGKKVKLDDWANGKAGLL